MSSIVVVKPMPFFIARADLARRQRLAAQHAVLVGEGEAHDRELARLDAPLDLARRGLAVLVHRPARSARCMRVYATSGGAVSAAQLEPLRRRSSNSFQ